MLLKLDDLARHHHQLSNYGFDCLFFLAVLWWGIEKSRPPPHHLGSSCVSRLWLFSITFCLSREDSREEQHHQLLWWGGGCYFQYLNQISAMKDFTGMREKELYIYGGHVQHMMGIAGRKKKYVENMANWPQLFILDFGRIPRPPLRTTIDIIQVNPGIWFFARQCPRPLFSLLAPLLFGGNFLLYLKEK